MSPYKGVNHRDVQNLAAVCGGGWGGRMEAKGTNTGTHRKEECEQQDSPGSNR